VQLLLFVNKNETPLIIRLRAQIQRDYVYKSLRNVLLHTPTFIPWLEHLTQA